jgi:hypothetical protein
MHEFMHGLHGLLATLGHFYSLLQDTLGVPN